jgi:hypothetical protein
MRPHKYPKKDADYLFGSGSRMGEPEFDPIPTATELSLPCDYAVYVSIYSGTSTIRGPIPMLGTLYHDATPIIDKIVFKQNPTFSDIPNISREALEIAKKKNLKRYINSKLKTEDIGKLKRYLESYTERKIEDFRSGNKFGLDDLKYEFRLIPMEVKVGNAIFPLHVRVDMIAFPNKNRNRGLIVERYLPSDGQFIPRHKILQTVLEKKAAEYYGLGIFDIVIETPYERQEVFPSIDIEREIESRYATFQNLIDQENFDVIFDSKIRDKETCRNLGCPLLNICAYWKKRGNPSVQMEIMLKRMRREILKGRAWNDIYKYRIGLHRGYELQNYGVTILNATLTKINRQEENVILNFTHGLELTSFRNGDQVQLTPINEDPLCGSYPDDCKIVRIGSNQLKIKISEYLLESYDFFKEGESFRIDAWGGFWFLKTRTIHGIVRMLNAPNDSHLMNFGNKIYGAEPITTRKTEGIHDKSIVETLLSLKPDLSPEVESRLRNTRMWEVIQKCSIQQTLKQFEKSR